MEAEVEILFKADEEKSGKREKELKALFAQVAGGQRLLSPLRCGTVAEMADV